MLKKIAGLCFVTLALTACESAPAVGEWEHEDNTSSYKDEISIVDDGTGERTVAIRDTFDDGVSFNIDIAWEIDWEETGDEEYEAELECDSASIRIGGELQVSGCAQVASALEANFELESECVIKKDGDEMECDTDGVEDTYEKVD